MAAILFAPVVLEAVLAPLLPFFQSSLYAVFSVVSSASTYTLAIANYGTQTLPYYLDGSLWTLTMENFLQVWELYLNNSQHFFYKRIT